MTADAQIRSEENARKTGDIRRALHRITDNYLATFDPGVLADEGERGGHNATSGEPVNLDHVQARSDAERDIRYWAHFVLDELKDGPTTATVHASDVLGCVTLIDRWADQIVTHHPDDADELRRNMRRHARRLRRIALSLRSKKILVGQCPELVLAGDVGMEELLRCQGVLFALLNEEEQDDDSDQIDLLPKRVVCDLEGDHAWTPWEWRDLGKRLGA